MFSTTVSFSDIQNHGKVLIQASWEQAFCSMLSLQVSALRLNEGEEQALVDLQLLPRFPKNKS